MAGEERGDGYWRSDEGSADEQIRKQGKRRRGEQSGVDMSRRGFM